MAISQEGKRAIQMKLRALKDEQKVLKDRKDVIDAELARMVVEWQALQARITALEADIT